MPYPISIDHTESVMPPQCNDMYGRSANMRARVRRGRYIEPLLPLVTTRQSLQTLAHTMADSQCGSRKKQRTTKTSTETGTFSPSTLTTERSSSHVQHNFTSINLSSYLTEHRHQFHAVL